MDKHIRDALLDLKKQVHNRATFPNGIEDSAFINLNVLDALINNSIRKYTTRNEGGVSATDNCQCY